MIGGNGKAAIRRTATVGDGWIMGGGGPEQIAEMAPKLLEAWDKPGRPRLVAIGYYALGPDARQRALSYLGDYYSVYGYPPEVLADHAALSEDAVRQTIKGFAEVGCDKLILFPCVA
jgi:alkanesulfonate monooxygenase SsuD/methylene tetrahydromethanopterin reductase-like flavin-dependent oxidoreductase (luciferase family)